MTETDLKREIVDPTLLPLPSNFHIHLEGLQAAESPFWDAVSGCVWLVDMLAPALIRVDPQSDATRIWPMPETIGSFALCEGGGAIVALRSGVFLYDFETERLTLIARPEATDKPFNRTSRSIDLSNRPRTPSEPWISRPCGRFTIKKRRKHNP